MEGSILLSRGILDSQVFSHQTALKIWIWCLCKATYKERFVPLKIGKGEISVKLRPGQFIFGRFKAEEELGIDGSTIYRWINRFVSEEYEMLKIECNNQYSIITICKWEEYQIPDKHKRTTNEQPTNSGRTAEEQPTNTNNKVNKVYNVFYDSEVEKSKNDLEYLKIVKALFGENNLGVPLNCVLKMETQLSYEQFKRIQSYKRKYSFSIVQLLESMENWGNPKKYKTVYGTFQTFLKRELKLATL